MTFWTKWKTLIKLSNENHDYTAYEAEWFIESPCLKQTRFKSSWKLKLMKIDIGSWDIAKHGNALNWKWNKQKSNFESILMFAYI